MARWTMAAAMAAVLGATQTAPATAQGGEASPCGAGLSSCAVGDRVLYLPAFFAQYNPVTALDMVQRVPGFSIDTGDEVRGFGAAGGNVLIDGQRPSTKSADLEDVLARIGAGNVARIELIRGGTGGLDVGGQSVVANVVLAVSATGREPSPWELSVTKRRPDGGVRPSGEISYKGNLNGVRYTLGLNASSISLVSRRSEQITRFAGDDESRVRRGEFRNRNGGGNISLEKPFANGDVLRLNFEGIYEHSREEFVETRFLVSGGPDTVLFPIDHELFMYEFGADYEHQFSSSFGGKLIGLYERTDHDDKFGFEFIPALGEGRRSLFVPEQDSGETIGRLEFDWTGLKGHTIQFGGEVVHNFLESNAQFFVDDGAGGLVLDSVAGANTRVSEIRGEPFIKDSWAVSPNVTLDLGFAFEFSRISQSGDADNSRFFTYPKPSVILTYRMGPRTQWRLSGEREVNQLSFEEFVSAVNFDDEDVDFGNPELQPQRTWAARLEFERRFGDIGVIELAGFFDYVEDVEDLLPIGGVVEVPGNIGDGEVWGATVDLTAPLDFLGLKNARLESSITLQDSSVDDPVTGLDRDFSFTRDYFGEVEFRQDFPRAKISWGWRVARFGEQFGFGLDEISTFSSDEELDAFIETTIIDGVKVQLEANDILNVTNSRDRTVFAGSRALGVPLFREWRGDQNGGGVTLTLSGTF